MTLYSYPITVEREGKRYYAYSEDFPGVYGLGKSIEEAKKSILEAMRLYIQHCRKRASPFQPLARSTPKLSRWRWTEWFALANSSIFWSGTAIANPASPVRTSSSNIRPARPL